MTASHSDDRQAVTSDARAIEKMLCMGLTLREDVDTNEPADRPPFWVTTMIKIEIELAAKTDDLIVVMGLLRRRDDANSRALLAYAEFVLVLYGDKDTRAAAALGKATQGRYH